MKIQIDSHTEVDTDRDLSAEERHIVQKLLCYKTFVSSITEFREKTAQALEVGWNNSGPIEESKSMKLVVQQMEEEIGLRLEDKDKS